jgi:hypothetical protein
VHEICRINMVTGASSDDTFVQRVKKGFSFSVVEAVAPLADRRTSSTTCPSGKSVGSSRTRRPLWT